MSRRPALRAPRGPWSPGISLAIAALSLGAACRSSGHTARLDGRARLIIEPLASPAGAGSSCPRLSPGSELILSWVEESGDEARLLASRFEGSDWIPGFELGRGADWFVNWADTPGAVAGEGSLFVHRLVEIPAEHLAYGIHGSSVALDAPATSSDLGSLHTDLTPTEHGFVSAVWSADADFFSVWLDGRATGEGGAMKLMGRSLNAGGFGPEIELDPRVCSCCPTSAVRLADGSVLAAYRGRDEREVRDIQLVRGFPNDPSSWSAPETVHRDGWVVLGCPVNGPALAAGASSVALAWYTEAVESSAGARREPRVRFALDSGGDGRRFAWPLKVDDGAPLGRAAISVVPGTDAYLVAWLERSGAGAEWRVRLVQEGLVSDSRVLARVPATRASGFLALSAAGHRARDGVFAAWTDPSSNRVRVARIRIEAGLEPASLPVPE